MKIMCSVCLLAFAKSVTKTESIILKKSILSAFYKIYISHIVMEYKVESKMNKFLT